MKKYLELRILQAHNYKLSDIMLLKHALQQHFGLAEKMDETDKEFYKILKLAIQIFDKDFLPK